MSRLVLFGDNNDISPTVFAEMLRLRKQIAVLADDRERVIRELNLDRPFCVGDANWTETGSASDFIRAYGIVRNADYGVLNRLRVWTPAFTGYDIARLMPGSDTRALESIPPDHDAWLRANRAEEDAWVNHYREMIGKLPSRYRFSPPAMLGEVGWDVDGVIVSHDTCAYQERLGLIWTAGIFDKLERLEHFPRILEIGAGYGALAYALRGLFPNASYMICDLPESLMFSGLYLTGTTTVPPTVVSDPVKFDQRPGVSLVPNYLFEPVAKMRPRFDLVINTLSMSEMSEHQIATYAKEIVKMLAPGAYFFEQNHDNTHSGLPNAKTILEPYFARRFAVQPDFPLSNGQADLWGNGTLDVAVPVG